MKIKSGIKFIDFLQLVDIVSIGKEQFDAMRERVKKKPSKELSGKQIPHNLDKLTYGQLTDLQNIKTAEDFLFLPPKIIMDIDRDELLQCTVHEVLSFSLFIEKEIERIARLFEKERYKPSPDEVQAGINNINHGHFGVADWYARRMGITDQQTVFDTVAWIKIYMCMKMDNDNQKFEKRYRNILSNKTKKK